MNDTTKLIIGAIVVLLIILVGAYALSNGSNQPAASATPTAAASTTATPTPAASVTPVPSATVAPTATTSATATPTATPKPSGSSGVKLTEFGYYITYPPFSYNEFFANPSYMAPGATPTPSPSPSPTPEGTVTFAYNYGTINWNHGDPWSTSEVVLGEPVDGYLPIYIQLHRTGDTSNAYWTDIEVSASISEWGYNSANPGFNAGSADMIYELDLPVSYLSDGVYTEVILTLDDPDPYTATPYQTFWLYINGGLN